MGELTKKGVKSNHQVRLNVAKEVVMTERTYVEGLKKMQELYLEPLQSLVNTPKEIFSQSDLDTAFAPNNLLRVIIGVNEQFLNDLEDRISNWNTTCVLGDLFVQFAPYFKMYTEYVNNHDNATTFLNNLAAEKGSKAKKFSKFARKVETNPRSAGLSLTSFLILPIQRIPRYQLLLGELWRNTGINHLDHKPLTEALSMVKTVAIGINEAVRKSQLRQQILIMEKKFEGSHSFVAPHRHLIRDGTLLRQTRGSVKPFYFVLFNDLLLYAVEKRNRFSLHQKIPINAAFQLAEVTKETAERENGWQVISNVKSFVVYAKNEVEKKQWLDDLLRCKEMFQQSIKKQGGEDVVAQAVWQRDLDSSACTKCMRPFTLLNRRHHCRSCGALVCNDCSKGRMLLPGFAGKPQRVCKTCFEAGTKPVAKLAGVSLAKAEENLSAFSRLVASRQKLGTGLSDIPKPPELPPVEAALFHVDSWSWVPHESFGFVPAKLEHHSGHTGTFFTIHKERMVLQIPFDQVSNLPPATETSYFGEMNDLIELDEFSEGAILHQLRARYSKDKVYTNMGGVLVAINPFKMLPIYTSSVMRQYMQLHQTGHQGASAASLDENKEPLLPHVFEIAASAHKGVVHDQRHQSIIISGESGSGKTETTKLILLYLSEMGGSESAVEQDILNSSPILEAFGNAKTVQNDNSSRFGKYVEVQFGRQNSRIVGARIRNYLLEKVRVVSQAPGERNYHILYQMCAAASLAEVDSAEYRLLHHLQLGEASSFHYLIMGDSTHIDSVNDDEDFETTMESLTKLGFLEDEVQRALVLLASILHLGNLDIVQRGDEGSFIRNHEQLVLVCSLSGMDPQALESAICFQSLKVGLETTMIPLLPERATDQRDALAKSLYQRLFEWLVDRINYALLMKTGATEETSDKNVLTVGVLDIYGFEIFENNSLEQFCINLANEMLQQYFNEQIFKTLQEQYTAEGLDVERIQFADNSDVIELITMKKPTAGILKMLDEELLMPQCSDSHLARRMHASFHEHQETRHPAYDRLLKFNDVFIVNHYAGKVEYNVVGFCDKNRDKLQPMFEDLLLSSGNSFVQELVSGNTLGSAPKNAQDGKSQNESGNVAAILKRVKAEQAARKAPLERVRQKAKTVTVGSKFEEQLHELMKTLKNTDTSFIRCIKPNAYKVANHFDSTQVLRQMRNGGLFETIRIRREGYPKKCTHKQFVSRYMCIVRLLNNQELLQEESFKDRCKELLSRLESEDKLVGQDIVVGKNLVFWRISQDRILEACRQQILDWAAVKIQNFFQTRTYRQFLASAKKTAQVAQEAMKTRNVTKLEQAIAFAEDNTTPLNLEEKFIRTLKKLKCDVETHTELASLLSKAVGSRNVTRLEEVLERVDDFHPVVPFSKDDLIKYQAPRVKKDTGGKPQLVIGLYDFAASEPEELSFKVDDVIKVVDVPQGNMWWTGELNGKKGIFPSNYTEPHSDGSSQTEVEEFDPSDNIHTRELSKFRRLVKEARGILQQRKVPCTIPGRGFNPLGAPGITSAEKLAGKRPDGKKIGKLHLGAFGDKLSAVQFGGGATRHSVSSIAPPPTAGAAAAAAPVDAGGVPPPSAAAAVPGAAAPVPAAAGSVDSAGPPPPPTPAAVQEDGSDPLGKYAAFKCSVSCELSSFVELRSEESYTRGMFRRKRAKKELLKKRFVFQKDVVPRSMCQFTTRLCGDDDVKDTLKELSVQNFSNILGFCHTKYHAYPETNGHAVVSLGFREPLLRDEVFAQLIKQTTEAPLADALMGWKLVFLCLTSFIPSRVNSYQYSENDGGGPAFLPILLSHMARYAHTDVDYVKQQGNNLPFATVQDVATHCYFQYMANMADPCVQENGSKATETTIDQVMAVSQGRLTEKREKARQAQRERAASRQQTPSPPSSSPRPPPPRRHQPSSSVSSLSSLSSSSVSSPPPPPPSSSPRPPPGPPPGRKKQLAFCTSCGAKKNNSAVKFCQSCGGKF